MKKSLRSFHQRYVRECPVLRFCLLALVASLVASGAVAQVMISEFDPNPPGTDPTVSTFELVGPPMGSFSNYWIISIENDGINGLVDRAAMVSGTFDANGLAVVTVPDLENPTFTVVLLDNFTGAAAVTDIDTNDDGTVDDTSTFGTVLDAIGVPDSVTDTATLYAAQLGGTNLVYPGAPPSTEPTVVFRDFSTGAFYAFFPDTVTPPGQIYDATGTEVLASAFIYGDPTNTSYGALNPSTVFPVELQSFSVE